MARMRLFGESIGDLLAEFGGAAAAVILNDHIVFPTVLGFAQKMAPNLFGNSTGIAVRELNAGTTAATGAGLGIVAEHVVDQRTADEIKRGGVGIGALRAVVGAFQGGSVLVNFPPANALTNPFGGMPALAAGAVPTTAGGTPTQTAPPAPVVATTSGDLGI